VLIARFSEVLSPDFRVRDDLKLLSIGLPKGHNEWPRLEPIFKSLIESNAINVGFKIVDLYEKADDELAAKMEATLASRWKPAANSKLTHAARAEAIRRSMTRTLSAAKISPAERTKQLQALVAKSPLSKPLPAGHTPVSSLEDTVRLTHASTMVSLLFSKDAEPGIFDELVAAIPGAEQAKPAAGSAKPDDNPRKLGSAVIYVERMRPHVSTGKLNEGQVDPLRGTYRKEYFVHMKAGETYSIDVRSKDFVPHLTLEVGGTAKPLVDDGVEASITTVAHTDGDYKLVVSSANKGDKGSYTLQVTVRLMMLRPGFRFGAMQPPPPADPRKTVENKASSINTTDLSELANRKSNVRLAAFQNLAGNVTDELAYRHAAKIAAYLLQTDWEESEQNSVISGLPSFARCRSLLEAVADAISHGEKLTQQRTERVVGGLLGQELHSARDEDWRLASRVLLLKRAGSLGGPKSTTVDADAFAGYLRDLYQAQGMAFGLDESAFEEQAQLTAVMERLIKHVAASTSQKTGDPAEKADLEQVDRQVQAARAAAESDLEFMIRLQRIWIKVLASAVRDRTPAPGRRTISEAVNSLSRADRASTNLLDQLRLGEEKILQVWVAALDLKVP
jgi:hypothetical protein